MRRSIILVVLTVGCWGFAMACSDGGGVPQPSAPTPTGSDSADGPLNLLAPDGGGTVIGGGTVDVPIFPVLAVTAKINGKDVVQDGLYSQSELAAQAIDTKGQPTTFHWSLVGPGINGGQFADGAEVSFKLPVVADKAAYELTAIGNLGGKAVQQTINFFTVPAPTAKIVANVNQAAGLPVLLAEGGAVLKGQKIQFSAEAKFADLFKWKVVKNNGAATDLGQTPTVEFVASEVASYKVLLMAFGPGGNTGLQPLEFKFDVKDNAVAITVNGQVTKLPDYVGILKAGGQYPVGSTVVIDASGVGEALGSMQCTVVDAAKVVVKPAKQSDTQYAFSLETAGEYLLNCTYALKEGYEPLKGEQLETAMGFKLLPKTVAKMSVNGMNCNPATPLVFEVGKTVDLSAATSSGNISSYSWVAFAGALTDGDKANATLKLNDAVAHPLTLSLKGIGDSDSATCTIYAQPLPTAVIASDSTVHDGRSYIAGSYQRAHATVTKGIVEAFDWSLLNVGGVVLKQSTTQNAKGVFEFVLSEVGELTLKLTSKLMNLTGSSSAISLNSKSGQVSLITPVDFSNIQSIAAISNSDVYFASSSAIFHKGADGRVVQVKNISDHPALPDGFFARNAGDIYLLTTDGGYWRYTFKEGWVFTPMNLGVTVYGLAVTGTPAGNLLYVAASNTRLFEVTMDTGASKMISGGFPKVVTMLGNDVYAAANKGTSASSGVMKCVSASCKKMGWAAGNTPAAGVEIIWKAIGATNQAVFLSDGGGRISTIKDDRITSIGKLGKDDYVVSFSPRDSILFAMGNKGGVYQIDVSGATLLYTVQTTITHAAGVDDTFWAWDNGNKKTIFVKDANLVTVTAQSPLGTPTAPCVDQKKMWMVEDVAYVSICSVIAGNLPSYTVWSTPYQGDIAANSKLALLIPVVGVASDGAEGLLVMRSDGVNNNVMQQKKADGTVQIVNVPLNPGEFFTGMSGKFLITNQGIRVNIAPDYPFENIAPPITDAHYPIADGDVLYFAMANDTRVARYELSKGKVEVLANADPQEGPIVAVHNVGGRVFFLTAIHLYRAEENVAPTVIYTAPAALMTSMAIMNGHHMLVSLGVKGAVLVDLDKENTSTPIDVGAEAKAGLNITAAGYNGTEFMLFGRDSQTNALFLHQYGAPQ